MEFTVNAVDGAYLLRPEEPTVDPDLASAFGGQPDRVRLASVGGFVVVRTLQLDEAERVDLMVEFFEHGPDEDVFAFWRRGWPQEVRGSVQAEAPLWVHTLEGDQEGDAPVIPEGGEYGMALFAGPAKYAERSEPRERHMLAVWPVNREGG